MTPATLVFVLAQFADILLTEIGYARGMAELNPLGYTSLVIWLKIGGTVFVASFMEFNRRRLRWLVWVPAGIMCAVVAWNVVNIMAG